MRHRHDLGGFARGPFSVDYEARVDHQELRSERRERARTALREAGLDAVLVWKDENVRFLSGLRAQIIQGKSALLNGCLLTKEGDLVLFLSGGEVDRAREDMTWIDEVHPIPIMEARNLIAGAVDQVIRPVFAKLGLEAGRIGLDEASFALLESLSLILPDAELADGDQVMQAIRTVKTPAELALMQEAAAIGDAVTEAAVAAIRPGVREYEVAAEAMRTLYRLGGEMAHVATPFVASGERMSPPHRFASDKLIREGDLVFIDIGAQFNGYFNDVGRTVVCGTPSRTQREIFTAVHRSLMAAAAAMKPGATNDQVAAAALEEGRSRGFGDRFLSLFIGHGIGMGANEPPYVGEGHPGADTIVLREGMTMAIEPLIWVPGVRGGGGVRLEDTILVDKAGGVPLNRTAFDERLLLA